jgi:hypothetical protein
MSLFEIKFKIQLFVKLALTTNVMHFNKRNAYKLNLKLIINVLKVHIACTQMFVEMYGNEILI